jgi:hypothetical protein
VQEKAEQLEPPPKRAKAGESTEYALTKGLNEKGESDEEDDELLPVEASSEDEGDTEMLVPKAPKEGAKVSPSPSFSPPPSFHHALFIS